MSNTTNISIFNFLQVTSKFPSKMNTIDNIQDKYDSSIKSYKSKTISGKKERATRRYFKDAAARSRRKQDKVRHDTFRCEQQPDAQDLWLEDLHFANFLGLSNCEWGKGEILMTYNGGNYSEEYNIDNDVNILACDLYIKQEQRIREEEQQFKKEQQWEKEQEEQRKKEEKEKKQETLTAGKCNCEGDCVVDHKQICFSFLLRLCKHGDNCCLTHVPEEEIPQYLELYRDDDTLDDEEAWALDPLPLPVMNTDTLPKWPEPTCSNIDYYKEHNDQVINCYKEEFMKRKQQEKEQRAFEHEETKKRLIHEAYAAEDWSVSTPKLHLLLEEEERRYNEIEAMYIWLG
jgi:hypothetical protein